MRQVKITNPKHLTIFAEAHAKLPDDVYQFFVRCYSSASDEQLPDLLDAEIEVIKFFIAADGDLDAAWRTYQHESRCSLENDGLNPIFRMYKKEVFELRQGGPTALAGVSAAEPSDPSFKLNILQASDLNHYDPSLYMDNELADQALDRLPCWLYDLLMPQYYAVQEAFCSMTGVIEYLVQAGGDPKAAIAAVEAVNAKSGGDKNLPTGKILFLLRSLAATVESEADRQ